MARPSSNPARLRTALVVCYLALASIHSAAAFVLAWFSKGDPGAFLLTGVLTAAWAAVVATTPTVTMRDLSFFRRIRGTEKLNSDAG